MLKKPFSPAAGRKRRLFFAFSARPLDNCVELEYNVQKCKIIYRKQKKMNMTTDKKTIDALTLHPLFAGTCPEALERALSSGEVRDYRKGDVLNEDEAGLYFLSKGRAKVVGTEGGAYVMRTVLQPGSVFGAAQLFSRTGKMSFVVALTAGSCLFLPTEAIERFLKEDGRFAMNYIVFLSDRIRFLNRRISSFTAGHGENMLAAYLLSLPGVEDGASLTMKLSMTSLASSLGVTRPTLYRAFAFLEESGAIRKDGKTVLILSKEILKNTESRY